MRRLETECPDCEALAAYVDRGLGKRDRTKLEQHIASCPQCIRLIAGVIRTLVEPRQDSKCWLMRP